jgi:superfamily I DNA/RNA helicase
MQFVFSTISEAQIQSSKGGNEMMRAIEFKGDRAQLITGRPGSGKTTVTIMRAQRLTKLGKSILLITKQNLLVHSLKNAYRTVHNIWGIDAWFRKNTGKLLWEISDAEEVKSLLIASGYGEGAYQYDEVLIDEGQDLGGYIYKALPIVGKSLLVGADTAQRLYENGADAATIEQLLEEQGRKVKPTELQYNYRNFVETYNFARQFVPEVAAAHSSLILEHTTKGTGGQARLPRVIQVVNEFDRLSNILEDNSTVNVAIVLYFKEDAQRYYDELTKRGLECSVYYHDMEPRLREAVASDMKSILVTTYYSIKGLEFPVVVMPAMEQAKSFTYQTDNFYYVGCTRATERLYLLYQGANLPECLKEFNTDTYQHIRITDSMPRSTDSTPARPTFGEEPPF